MELNHVTQTAAAAAREFLQAAGLKAGDILVVGCSSSEILGEQIGHGSSLEAAQAVFDGIYPVVKEAGVFLAAQCCEHLNRAIIIEEAAVPAWVRPVNVVPQPKAGGSFATLCFKNFEHPVALENIQADAGMDIGDTLIGMHLKPVAVPVRLSMRKIGDANLVCARTRLKFIGGSRAIYQPEV